jgi:diadenosine tetraphosphatase ApaH/serine/threonine PP2A family protein phosphatase
MKLGILADIHSNLEALNCALDALKDVSGFICPGDIVGYGPNPNECVEIVRKLDCRTVAGNHDYAGVGKLDPSNFSGDAREAIEWTAKVLTEENRKFLQSLPEYIENEKYEMVHGSLRNPIEEYITNVQVGAATLELMQKKICFVGHLHIPLVVVKEKGSKYDGWQLNDGDTIEIKKFDKIVINTGGVGQPRDMDTRASFGVYDTEKQTVEIRKIEYNISAVQEKMRKAYLPEFLIERLKYGR